MRDEEYIWEDSWCGRRGMETLMGRRPCVLQMLPNELKYGFSFGEAPPLSSPKQQVTQRGEGPKEEVDRRYSLMVIATRHWWTLNKVAEKWAVESG